MAIRVLWSPESSLGQRSMSWSRSTGSSCWGRHHPQSQFPLLFKFLDAQRNLSLQVHPDDARAARLTPPDFGKTEAWLILDREPGSLVYAGLSEGVDRAALEKAIAERQIETCLHAFEPEVGDCIFVPAGVVHAIGAGLLVAEIQQSSDTTYRLYDWNRLGTDGRPRELHVASALEATDFERGPVTAQTPEPTDQAHVRRLVACEKFVLDRWELDSHPASNGPHTAGGDDRCHLLTVLEGEVILAGDRLSRGETMLLPAACGPTPVEPQGRAVLIDMYLP